jgi:hypothetical protein
MYNGPKIPTEGIVFALDASSLRGVSGTGNTSYNGAPSAAKNIVNRGENVSTVNGTRLTNVNYYTSFGISYPEGNYGGAAANRQGLTAGFNVTSGGKTYDASRALHLWVWDNRTNTWVPDSFFNGLRLGGHCYDNWAGAESGWQNELNKFNADFINIRNSFPDSTWIVNGSHASQMFDSTTINNLISLGAPSGTISSWTDGSAWREFVLVGEPGLGSGNYYGWAYENYSVDPSVVAHLVFPLPLKGNKSSAFLFDGTNQYITISPFNPSSFTGLTLSVVANMSSASGGWSRFFDIGSGSDNNNLLFCRYSDTSNLFFGVYNGSGNSQFTFGGNIQFNSIAHYVATADGTNFRIYVNGQLVHTAANSTIPIVTSRENGYIGRSNWADPYYNGTIQAATIYNRAISSTEVTQAYNAYRSRFNI